MHDKIKETAIKALHKDAVTLTIQLKILPDACTQKAILKTMRVYRAACMEVSRCARMHKMASSHALHKNLYREIREKFALSSQMTESVFRTVAAAYKAMKTTDTWTLARFDAPLANWVFGRDYKVIMDSLSLTLNTINGWVDVPFIKTGMEKYLDGLWRFGTARIKRTDSEWIFEIPVTKQIPTLDLTEARCVVGVDVGLNFLIVAYDSAGNTRFFRGKNIKRRKQNFFNRRTELSSRKTQSARRRKNALGNREYRWMQDVNHRTAKELVMAYPEKTIFVLEDLTGFAPKLQTANGKTFYSLATWPYADLRQKIEYKALKRGSRVIVINPNGTSKICPKCGYSSYTNRNKRLHELKCGKCGYTSNDDRAAAMNIFNAGIALLETL